MRDHLKSASWFDKWVAFRTADINQRIEIRRQPAVNQAYEPQYAKDLAFHQIKLLLCLYSRGSPTSDLSQYFDPFLNYWEESERLGKEIWTADQLRRRHTWAVNLDHYIDCFWLVGLALALDLPDDQWRRLIELIGNEGEDLLLDSIIASRDQGRKIGETLCYPKPYARLLKAIDAPKGKQAVLLNAFVEHWYQEVGKAARSGREKQAVAYSEPYWHGLHMIDGGYFGYWCLEAVAAVKAFGLDDSLCMGHPHYPGDFLRPGVVSPSDMSRLLPELAQSIGKEPPQPIDMTPRTLSFWEALMLVAKDKLRL